MFGREYQYAYNGNQVWCISFFANRDQIREVRSFLEENELILEVVTLGKLEAGISFTLSPLAIKDEVKAHIFSLLDAEDVERREDIEILLEEVDFENTPTGKDGQETEQGEETEEPEESE